MRTILLPLLLLLALPAAAQQGAFHYIGTATPMDNGCVLLTPDSTYMEGIAYSTRKLDLLNPFEISFSLFLGDNDELGADGITFVIHNDPRGFNAYGTFGECIGYGRWSPYSNSVSIRPSIAVELDTYFNYRQNDPSHDHLAYLENGISYHEQYWPEGGEAASFNLEDGQLHNFKFRWVPGPNQIAVTLDGTTVFQGERDLINDVFGGQTAVIWGFTASTGRKHNLQFFCLQSLVQRHDLPPACDNLARLDD